MFAAIRWSFQCIGGLLSVLEHSAYLAAGERVEGRELVFLTKTETPKVIIHRLMPATVREKQRALDMSMAAVDGIYHERFYPQPGMHCSWCSYRAECSLWTEGGSQ
ncbi:PD-(D/E)XK nuclease family protein [Coraliomargarita sinensis]|uniref:PD-(D/E)XK nuclease family protein n=1 Tax=Coraliomargarita sinensis TaxID=2174842 RepID=UPI0013049772|nr:PD-(D/E)XK nuclease family protein [Coraliomargarita sinensis]